MLISGRRKITRYRIAHAATKSYPSASLNNALNPMSENWKKFQGRSCDENKKWVSINTYPPMVQQLLDLNRGHPGHMKMLKDADEKLDQIFSAHRNR